jgi:hypothetical protein
MIIFFSGNIRNEQFFRNNKKKRTEGFVTGSTEERILNS